LIEFSAGYSPHVTSSHSKSLKKASGIGFFTEYAPVQVFFNQRPEV
jgi:hypothetical protein